VSRALFLVVLLAACARGESRSAGDVKGGSVWSTRAPGGLVALDIGTHDPELLDSTTCRPCHTAAYDEWAASRHGEAWTNGIFQREYREKPQKWCVNCHAPTEAQVAEVAAGEGALARQGVGCAACHVRGGRLVSRQRGAGSPHATVVDASFGSPAFCADCHQFGFPALGGDGEPLRITAHPMQHTVAQFAASRYAKTHECLDCHASPGGHAFRGGHAKEMLERALAASICRSGERVQVSLENRGAGHNFPTGDLHRHLVARVWRPSAPEALFEIFIGRQFEDDPAGGKLTTWDSTLAPGQRRDFAVELARLAGEADEPVRFEVRYVYTADEQPIPRRDPGEPTSLVVVSELHELAELPACR
jgi:hypothetical protein